MTAFYSTRDRSEKTTWRDVVLQGLAKDGGLFLPESISPFPRSVIESMRGADDTEICLMVARQFLAGSIEDAALEKIVRSAITFPAPLRNITDGRFVLELFHGPTSAFKDFGARFLARTMSYFAEGDSKPITVLVATSGDTGGAVAAGFHQVPGVDVIILFPKGRVSPLQEQQLTTWGDNIHAIEIEGSFDDCQALAKQAFRDKETEWKGRLTSANSINLARLFPQSFYYFLAFAQLGDVESFSCSIPSGNFGNLTAAIFAKRLGLPIKTIIGATNSNNTVPRYLESGRYEPRPSQLTISNAMDVGDPSNIERLNTLCGGAVGLHDEIQATYYTDTQTQEILRRVLREYQYPLCPHSAIAWQAAIDCIPVATHESPTIALATAHPAKFHEVVAETIGEPVVIPESLAQFLEKRSYKTTLPAEYKSLRSYMLER